MPIRNTLTKSLHTITAVTNVAKLLKEQRGYGPSRAEQLLDDSLSVLGYNLADFPKSDETVARCRAAVGKVLAP